MLLLLGMRLSIMLLVAKMTTTDNTIKERLSLRMIFVTSKKYTWKLITLSIDSTFLHAENPNLSKAELQNYNFVKLIKSNPLMVKYNFFNMNVNRV